MRYVIILTIVKKKFEESSKYSISNCLIKSFGEKGKAEEFLDEFTEWIEQFKDRRVKISSIPCKIDRVVDFVVDYIFEDTVTYVNLKEIER